MNLLIIQARMGSTRLPGKVLREIDGIVALDRCIQRCQAMKYVDEVVVATSTLAGDDVLEDWCNQNRILSFRGSEDDVLDRYVQCAREHEAQIVIRVTSDCPFVDHQLGDQLIQKAVLDNLDYVFCRSLPAGLVVEPVPMQTLEWIHANGHEPRHREHVTYYMKEFREKFQTAVFDLPEIYRNPQLRMTLDTPEDYAMLSAAAAAFPGDVLVPTTTVIQWLLDHPEVAALNGSIRQKEVV